MKVNIQSIIKSTPLIFECFDDQQIIFEVGNTLCLREFGRPDCQFVCLNKHMERLLSFKAMTNRKGVFTAEMTEGEIELAVYSLGGERKAVPLPLEHGFANELQKI